MPIQGREPKKKRCAPRLTVMGGALCNGLGHADITRRLDHLWYFLPLMGNTFNGSISSVPLKSMPRGTNHAATAMIKYKVIKRTPSSLSRVSNHHQSADQRCSPMGFAIGDEIVNQEHGDKQDGNLESIKVEVHVVLPHDPSNNDNERNDQ